MDYDKLGHTTTAGGNFSTLAKVASSRRARRRNFLPRASKREALASELESFVVKTRGVVLGVSPGRRWFTSISPAERELRLVTHQVSGRRLKHIRQLH